MNCRRVIISVVKGMAAPSRGRATIDEIRRRMPSRSSERDDLAVSRTGFRASAKGSFSSPVLESSRKDRLVTASTISYARKQSVVRFALICMLSSRKVFANSANALRHVASNAIPQSPLGNIAEILWNSARNMPSIPLA